VHYHCVFLEGVYLDRTDQGLKPRFVKAEPPTDADMAAVVQKISRRVIRTLWRLGYLEGASTRLWPPAMIPCVMTSPGGPASIQDV
jgi:hypothetical protein